MFNKHSRFLIILVILLSILANNVEASNDLNYLEEANIVRGDLPNSGYISREYFSEIIINFYEYFYSLPTLKDSDYIFSDTSNEKVLLASKLKLISGVGDNKFSPNRGITKEEASVVVYRLLKSLDYMDKENTVLFKDFDDISIWAKDASVQTYLLGITHIDKEQFFNPSREIDSDDLLFMIERLFLEITKNIKFNK